METIDIGDSSLAEKVTEVVLYAAETRDRTQGFLHTGDFSGPEVESIEARVARREVSDREA